MGSTRDAKGLRLRREKRLRYSHKPGPLREDVDKRSPWRSEQQCSLSLQPDLSPPKNYVMMACLVLASDPTYKLGKFVMLRP